MALIGARTLTVTRVTAASWVSGDYVVSAESTLEVRATVHPIANRERQVLPEGIRETARLKMYTNTQLIPVGAGQAADRVEVGGVLLTVTGDSDWHAAHLGGVHHYRYILTQPSHERE